MQPAVFNPSSIFKDASEPPVEIPASVSGQSTVTPVIEVDASSMVELCWEVQAHNELIFAVRDRQSERGNLLIGFSHCGSR